MTARSYLYVPCDRADRLARAPERGADALICDLEDGVGPARKDAARANLSSFLKDAAATEVWVRINVDERLGPDVEAACSGEVAGVVLPKATADAVARLALLLPAGVSIAPLCETAAGVVTAAEIARGAKVARLGLGEADLCAELGIIPSQDERELLAIRSAIVLASAAAGIDPPTAPVSTDFRDLDRFRASTQALKRLGFGSRSAIHPAQVEVVNEVFTPTSDELARARRVIEAFERAGGGACIDDEGRMIDEAVVRSARRTLGRS